MPYNLKNAYVNFLTADGIKKSLKLSATTAEQPIVAVPQTLSFVGGAFDILALVRSMSYDEISDVCEFNNGNKISIKKKYEDRGGIQVTFIELLVKVANVTVSLGNGGGSWVDDGAVYFFALDSSTVCTGAYLTIASIGNNKVFCLLQTFSGDVADGSTTGRSIVTYGFASPFNTLSSMNTVIANLLADTPVNIKDPYYGAQDNETPEGGFGPHDYTSEDETPPLLPSLSAANAGFISLWNPTIGEIGALADYLWGPAFSIASWQKLWNDPMECLLSLGIVPVSPTTGTRRNIFFGNADTGIESAPITDQFVLVDMGMMQIEGESASYLDYAPYCKASIYLPYCGTYALDVDEIMDADLYLEYHIDIYTGACVAYLTIDNRKNSDGSTVHNVMYQFTGNCLASIPVTSGDHSQLLQSLLFMGASIAATVATAGAGAASGGAIEGLAAEGDVVASSGVLGAATAGSVVNTVMSMKPNVMHSGNLSSTAGLLGGQKPFVTLTWSNLCRPEDEYQLVGMPIQKSGTLSDFEGFTIVSACHLDNILCTDAERSMIEQALGRGVIV